MNGTQTSTGCRPRTPAVELIPDSVLEELRQLRAAIAVYQKLVQRLTERGQAG